MTQHWLKTAPFATNFVHVFPELKLTGGLGEKCLCSALSRSQDGASGRVMSD